MLQIVDKEIRFFSTQLADKNVEIEVSEECRKWIAHEGFSDEFGARNIARLVQDKIKAYFVDEVLFGALADGGRARVDVKDNEIVIDVVETAVVETDEAAVEEKAEAEIADAVVEDTIDPDTAIADTAGVDTADTDTGDA